MSEKQTPWTKEPWPEPEYNNDTGPDDESFWEWYGIDGVGKFDNIGDAWRAHTCANACAGIPDPSAKIAQLREACQMVIDQNPLWSNLPDDALNDIALSPHLSNCQRAKLLFACRAALAE